MTTSDEEFRKKQRSRNIALAAVLLGLVVLFYVLAMVKVSGA